MACTGGLADNLQKQQVSKKKKRDDRNKINKLYCYQNDICSMHERPYWFVIYESLSTFLNYILHVHSLLSNKTAIVELLSIT